MNELKAVDKMIEKINYIWLLIASCVFVGCGIPQAEHDQIKLELKELKNSHSLLILELDECQNGAEKIVAEIEKLYEEKKFAESKEKIFLLKEKHPESKENERFERLLPVIEKNEREEKERVEAQRREQERLANLNNTGMWVVNFYVDEFGEPTSDAYVKNRFPVIGKFSNSATENSELKIDFLITNMYDISIMLYEYGGNNPVKAYSEVKYAVNIQDRTGKRIKCIASNYSDRLSLDRSSSKKLHGILLKGGVVKFKIYDMSTPTTKYSFSLDDADYYENAYRKKKEQERMLGK